MQSYQTKSFGRYEQLAEIGRGAMGVVYQGRDPKIERLVAIKTISLSLITAENGSEQEFRERFLLEARAAGRLSHPGIVTVFDVGEDPETDVPYIVMEYVAGQSLQKVLADSGKLALETSLQLASELAEALDYAHAQGVVHRDMKPANVMVTEDGHAKIADFGIAKLTLAQLTLGGTVFGTPAYMAPEQLEGGEVDGRADLFSLGVILYAMLTGHRPFQGNSAATVSFKVMNRHPVPATAFDAGFPPELDVLITKSMAKDPEQRYQTGREMAKDIAEILTGVREATDPLGPLTARLHSTRETGPEVINSRTQAKSLTLYAKRVAGPVAGALVLMMCAWAFLSLSPTTTMPLPRAPSPDTAATMQTVGRKSADSRVVFGPQPAQETLIANARVRAAREARGQRTSLASVADSKLEVSFEHNFAQAKIFVWIDDRLAYTHALKARAKRRLILFKEVQGQARTVVPVPSGKHQLRVRVQAGEGYDQSGIVMADFAANGSRVLSVRCEENPQRIALELQ